jgi:hypothetical protein
MSQKRIFVPTDGIESWKKLLADPDKHWKEGYSAYSTAESWEENEDTPKEIRQAFSKSEALKDLKLLAAFPEYQVPLPGGVRPSQNDVLAIMSNEEHLVVAAVEAKYRESFGDKSIGEWLDFDKPEGRQERLHYILEKIKFPTQNYKDLRYQLFHRLASAVIMAKKFHADIAVMIIQSFERNDSLNHYKDFSEFVEAYGKEIEKGVPVELLQTDSIKLIAVWVES